MRLPRQTEKNQVAWLRYRYHLIGRDDVRFQGKTGSSRPTAKVTRLTPLRHAGLSCAAIDFN